MAILYGLLNGFYEEFCFLGLLTCVEDKYKWQALAYSTLVRVSFHTYQGMLWATVIGVVFGLMYYFFYNTKSKICCRFPDSRLGRYLRLRLHLFDLRLMAMVD